MVNVKSEQARAALDAAKRAQQRVAEEIGLPRGYWWGMAAGWLALGVIADLGPAWLVTVATVVFGAGHSALASRLLGGRRRTSGLQVSATVAGKRTPLVVVGMLLALVGVTIGVAFALDADHARHPALWAAVLVAAVIGFGGSDILRVLRRWARA